MTHSVLPARRPKRLWVRTRPCKCGECRFYPLTRKCPEVIDIPSEIPTRASEWLWATEARGSWD